MCVCVWGGGGGNRYNYVVENVFRVEIVKPFLGSTKVFS